MEARILELLHRPENIAKEDIALLQKEISKYPYMQSLRTLQLSAVHLFEEENYQKELTKTAAFTTDKKILYQFINKKNIEEKKEVVKFKKINFKSEESQSIVSEPVLLNENQKIEVEESKVDENIIADTEVEVALPEKVEIYNEIENIEISENVEVPKEEIEQIIAEKPVASHPSSVIGDTELETSIIDKKENEFEVIKELEILEEEEILPFEIEDDSAENQIFKTRQEDLNFSKETVLEQFDQISETEKPVVKPSEISFNAFDSFLPDVKFTVPVAKTEIKSEPETPKLADKEIVLEVPKQEEIVEIAEISETEKPLAIVQEAIKEENSVEISSVNAAIPVEVKSDVEPEREEIIPEPEATHFEWKPMNFVQNPLDAHIKKQEIEKPKPVEKIVEQPIILLEIQQEKQEDVINEVEELIEKTENIAPIEEIPTIEEEEERPVLNVSFFSNEMAEISSDDSENEEEKFEKEDDSIQSNVPNFVNTWQSWLKIDRTEKKQNDFSTPTQPEKVIEKKAEIIDKFIEENPKISQLKEEVNFVVKEKADDISHLMTETLAKLYTSQRLYTKAINAYEVLKKKHPEKVDFFEAKIQEVKELKQGK